MSDVLEQKVAELKHDIKEGLKFVDRDSIKAMKVALQNFPFDPPGKDEAVPDDKRERSIKKGYDRERAFGTIETEEDRRWKEERERIKKEASDFKRKREEVKRELADSLLDLVSRIPKKDAAIVVGGLSEKERAVLMQYIYRGFENEGLAKSYPLFLSLHAEIVKKDGLTPIIRTIHSRPRLRV